MAVTSSNNLRYGSTGDDVKELQRLLNQNGYALDVDGSYGTKTQAAVRDYQSKNNLAVDGIVGTNTWGALTKASSNNSADSTAQPVVKTPTFEYGEYKPSDAVTQAEAMLREQMANKPGEYTSQWQSQLDEMLQKILNREEFSYDLNGDALYQQYKDQYTTQGKMAMMDTMGQAQAMTGGYGNSYAQTAGQQAYQGYLQGLNDKIPELYQLALNQYNAEGDAMFDKASIMAQMEDQDYGRYRDDLADYYAELDRLTDDSRYKAEQDYGKWADGRDFAYGQYSDDRAYAYQQERDKVADAQWQAQFDEAKRQFDYQNGIKSGGSSSGSSGGSSGGGSSSGGSGGGGLTYSEEAAKKQRELVAAGYDIEVDGKWGPKSKAAWADYQSGKGGGGGGSFTGSTYSEACAYLKSKGKSSSGLMTQSEWTRHKNNNNSAGGEHEASSYKEYLAAYIYGQLN